MARTYQVLLTVTDDCDPTPLTRAEVCEQLRQNELGLPVMIESFQELPKVLGAPYTHACFRQASDAEVERVQRAVSGGFIR